LCTVKYRSLERKDYEQIKQLINEAFNIHGLIKDKNDMMQGKEKKSQGSIELFIVSQESRGLGGID